MVLLVELRLCNEWLPVIDRRIKTVDADWSQYRIRSCWLPIATNDQAPTCLLYLHYWGILLLVTR